MMRLPMAMALEWMKGRWSLAWQPLQAAKARPVPHPELLFLVRFQPPLAQE
jgi:hypothetical protein